MIGFQFDVSDASRAAEKLAANEKQFQAAISGALTEAGKDGLRLIKQKVSASTKVSQKRLGVRIKMRRYLKDGRVVLWVGADPVALDSLGTVRQNTRSAMAGKITRRGAFLAHIAGGGLRAFIREKSAHYKEDQYGDVAYGVGYKKSAWGSMKSRFPVRLAVVRIDDEVETAMGSLDIAMQENFDKHFLRRLNYEVVVKGARS